MQTGNKNPQNQNNAKNKAIPDDAYLLIIGAMKSGTTSLFSYLSAHSQICASVIKEPEFFSDHQRHKTSFKSYADLWPHFDRTVHRYAMEASTGYTKYPWEPHAPERIRNYGIKPRFIYIMRDPFDRIESHFNFNKGKRGWNHGICDKQLISVSNYYLQLERFRRFFPRQDMLLLDFDELSQEPAQVLMKVYHFLGLPPSFPEEYGVKNPTLSLPWYVRRAIYRISPYYPKRLKGVSRKLLMRWAPSKRSRTLTSAEREYIRQALQDDMRRLHRVYGVSVEKWGFSE